MGWQSGASLGAVGSRWYPVSRMAGGPRSVGASPSSHGVVVREADGGVHAWECTAPCEQLLLTARWAVVGVGPEARFVRWRDGEA